MQSWFFGYFLIKEKVTRPAAGYEAGQGLAGKGKLDYAVVFRLTAQVFPGLIGGPSLDTFAAKSIQKPFSIPYSLCAQS